MHLFYAVALALAVSIDSFAAGIAYGLKGIRIPLAPLSLTGLTTAVCTAIAMSCAYIAGIFIDPRPAILIGALILILMGAFSLVQERLTNYFSCRTVSPSAEGATLQFSAGRLVITIMSRPEAADMDQSQEINRPEAFFLGLALGLDNMVACFASALIQPLPLYMPILMGLIQMGALALGLLASRHIISEKWRTRLPYLPGLLLITLGLLRLL